MSWVTMRTDISNNKLQLNIEVLDRELMWKEATIQLIFTTKVQDSRPVNSKKVLHTESFILESPYQTKEIDLTKHKSYTYKWQKISMDLSCKVIINDSIFFDTKISEKIERNINTKPKVSNNAKRIIQPKDLFDFFKNLQAIPHKNKIQVFWLAIIWWIIMAVNALIWIHDQFVSESQTFLYSHTDSDWDSSSPLGNSLAASWVLWAWVWFLMKKQLRKYMSFAFRKFDFPTGKDAQIKIKELLTWKPLVDLQDTTLRIVAANIEKGQYVRGSWTKRRTVSFSNPVRWVVLYEEKIWLLPQKENISQFLKWEFSFEEMYHTLYPEQKTWSSHGVWVHWEVQLIHNTFIDQELIWPKHFLEYNNFLNDK